MHFYIELTNVDIAISETQLFSSTRPPSADSRPAFGSASTHLGRYQYDRSPLLYLARMASPKSASLDRASGYLCRAWHIIQAAVAQRVNLHDASAWSRVYTRDCHLNREPSAVFKSFQAEWYTGPGGCVVEIHARATSSLNICKLYKISGSSIKVDATLGSIGPSTARRSVVLISAKNG